MILYVLFTLGFSVICFILALLLYVSYFIFDSSILDKTIKYDVVPILLITGNITFWTTILIVIINLILSLG